MGENIDLTDQNTILNLVQTGRIPTILDVHESPIRVAIPNAPIPPTAAIMGRTSMPDRVFYVLPDGTSYGTGRVQELTLYDANTMRMAVDDALIQTGQTEPTLIWHLHNMLKMIG